MEERHKKEKNEDETKMQERDERQTSYCCDKSEKGTTRIESWKRKYEEELPVIYTLKLEK